MEALKAALEELFQPFRSTYNADSADLTRTGRIQTGKQRERTESVAAPALGSRSRQLDNAETDAESQEGVEECEDMGRSRQTSRSRSLASADIDADDVPLFRQETPLAAADQDNAMLSSPGLSPEHGSARSTSPNEATTSARNGFKRTLAKPAMQMTLDTSGASWNLQPGSSNGPARKKAKINTNGDSRQMAIEHFRTFTSASGPLAATQLALADASEEEDEIEMPEEEDRHQGAGEDSLPEEDGLQAEDAAAEQDDSLDNSFSAGPAEAVRAGSAEAGESEEEPEPIRTDKMKQHEPDIAGTLAIDMSRIKRRYARREQVASPSFSHTKPCSAVLPAEGEDLEGAGIDHETEEAEKTLSRLVSKADFATMEVVGQFNVAFIIARRRHQPDRKGKGKAGVATVSKHDDLMIIECVCFPMPIPTD